MTLYEIIGVDPKATKEEIKAAYRALAHKWHPDKEGGDAKRFTAISKAYKILSSDEARERYDKTGNTDFFDVKKMAEDALMKLFLEVISKNSSEMLDNTDIIKFISKYIKTTLKNFKHSIKDMSKNKKRLIKIRLRIKHKNDKRNIFLLMIDHQMKALKGQAMSAGIQIKIWQEGLKILEEYKDNKEFPTGLLGCRSETSNIGEWFRMR